MELWSIRQKTLNYSVPPFLKMSNIASVPHVTCDVYLPNKGPIRSNGPCSVKFITMRIWLSTAKAADCYFWV